MSACLLSGGGGNLRWGGVVAQAGTLRVMLKRCWGLLPVAACHAFLVAASTASQMWQVDSHASRYCTSTPAFSYPSILAAAAVRQPC